MFSVGEDLFSVLVVVSLTAVFVSAMVHSYHTYAERRNLSDGFDLALDVADRIKSQVLAGQAGSLELSHERVEDYSRLLASQGVNMRVEVRGMEGELLFAHGSEMNPIERYASPPASSSLPVAVVIDQDSAIVCELSVEIWGA